MIDDDAGPKELGGELTKQDQLNLLRLQVRRATESAAKLPDLIRQLRADCPHEQVLEWVGSSGRSRYRLCTFCGLQEKNKYFPTTTTRQFTSPLRDVKPTVVSLIEGEHIAATIWQRARRSQVAT